MDRRQKEELVANMKEKFSSVKSAILTDYKGMTVVDISNMRNVLREAQIEYKVVKNTLAKIASEGTPLMVAKDAFTGPIGLAMGFDDPVTVSKKMLELARKNEKIKLLSGVVEGQLYSVDELRKISKLPSREVLLSQLGGVMNAPAAKLATALNATVARFGYALNALKDKKSKE